MTTTIATDDFDPKTYEILEERARLLARPLSKGDDDVDCLDVVVLGIGEERYGVELGRVREVRPLSNLTKVPGLPSAWAGIMNLRGSLYPVLDLAAHLGLHGSQRNQEVALVTGASLTVAVMADEIRTTVRIPKERVAPPVDGRSGFVLGVTSDLISVLDLDKLLADPHLVVDEEARQ